MVHATVTACGGGIVKPAASLTRALNSISFANSAGRFPGFAPASFLPSNDDPTAAGSNLTIDVDPRWYRRLESAAASHRDIPACSSDAR